MYVPDTLSRAYLPEEVEIPDHVSMLDFISVSQAEISEIQECTQQELNQLHTMILNGWLDTRQEVPFSIRPYCDYRSELAVTDGIIYKGMRIVIPPGLQHRMLEFTIHTWA